MKYPAIPSVYVKENTVYSLFKIVSNVNTLQDGIN